MAAIDLVVNNLISIIFFFVIYSVLYTIDINHFRGANSYLDIFYLTTSTQSSIGYGDVAPNSRTAKIIASIHHIVIILIMAHFVFKLTRFHR